MQGLFQIAAVLVTVFAIMGCPTAQAQEVYKCVKNGKTSFQSAPCEGGSISSLQARAATGGLPWEGLRFGMSADEVTRIVGGAQAEGGGTKVRLSKQDVKIVGIAFNATYSFDRDKGLSSVFLEKVGDKVLSLDINANDANLADYEKLRSFFRTKYGAETSSAIKSKATGFPGLSAHSYWSAEGGEVFVSISPVTGETSMMSLGYRERGGR
jgi:hypothetical protein